jgi:hypothetical protein
LKCKTHEHWVLIKNQILLGPYARPINHGSSRPTHSPQVRSHDPSTTCPQPKGRTQAPRVRWSVQPKGRSSSATCTLWSAQPKGWSSNVMCAQGVWALKHTPSAAWTHGGVPSPHVGAKHHVSPCGFSSIVITIFLYIYTQMT